jgi:hypothetical protein
MALSLPDRPSAQAPNTSTARRSHRPRAGPKAPLQAYDHTITRSSITTSYHPPCCPFTHNQRSLARTSTAAPRKQRPRPPLPHARSQPPVPTPQPTQDTRPGPTGRPYITTHTSLTTPCRSQHKTHPSTHPCLPAAHTSRPNYRSKILVLLQ